MGKNNEKQFIKNIIYKINCMVYPLRYLVEVFEGFLMSSIYLLNK